MVPKPHHPDFDRTLKILRAHSFDVASFAQVAGGVLLSKHGAGAVLVASRDKDTAGSAPSSFARGPGALIGGEVARLVDRGYQKFLKTSKAEISATAEHLKALHSFSEELKEAIGATSLYNESLGSVSEAYTYDRVKDRDLPDSSRPKRPWQRKRASS